MTHDEEKKDNELVVQVSIPHGFQLVGTLVHPKPTIKLVIHAPRVNNADVFLGVDPSFAHIWQNHQRLAKISLSSSIFSQQVSHIPTSNVSTSVSKEVLRNLYCGTNMLPSNKLGSKIPVFSISEIKTQLTKGGGTPTFSRGLYVHELHIYIVASEKLELVLLDVALNEMSRIPCPKPVLSLELDSTNGRIIVGCVASVYVWGIARIAEKAEGRWNYALINPPKLTLSDLESDEWVGCTLLVNSLDYLYVACERNLYLYRYSTGQRIHSAHSLHELSITCLLFDEKTGYVLTGSKDKMIRVWNCQHHLVCSFDKHTDAITGLIRPTVNTKDPPLIVISSSLDGTLRLWNVEKNACMYTHDTQSEVLGISMIRADFFYHFSKSKIFTWHLNHLLSTFSRTVSQVTRIFRIQKHFSVSQFHGPHFAPLHARIVVVSEDGAIRIVSALNGTCLRICYPTYKQTHIVDALHNYTEEKLYTLMSNGDIVTYSTNTNPAKITKIAEPMEGPEAYKILCFSAFLEKFKVFGGSDTGEIIMINLDEYQKNIVCCQAHKGKVTDVRCHLVRPLLLSCGEDFYVKLWSYQSKGKSMQLEFSYNCSGGIPLTCCFAQMKVEDVKCVPIMVATSDYKLWLWQDGKVYQHSVNDDHVEPLTSLEFSPTLQLFATSSMDGTVKVWNMDNKLVREIHIGQPVTSVAFANRRGDLVVGVHDEVSLLETKDYLLPGVMKKITEANIPLDLSEDYLRFDKELDFWQIFHQIPKLAQNAKWDLQKRLGEEKKLNPDDQDYEEIAKEIQVTDVQITRDNSASTVFSYLSEEEKKEEVVDTKPIKVEGVNDKDILNNLQNLMMLRKEESGKSIYSIQKNKVTQVAQNVVVSCDDEREIQHKKRIEELDTKAREFFQKIDFNDSNLVLPNSVHLNTVPTHVANKEFMGKTRTQSQEDHQDQKSKKKSKSKRKTATITPPKKKSASPKTAPKPATPKKEKPILKKAKSPVNLDSSSESSIDIANDIIVLKSLYNLDQKEEQEEERPHTEPQVRIIDPKSSEVFSPGTPQKIEIIEVKVEEPIKPEPIIKQEEPVVEEKKVEEKQKVVHVKNLTLKVKKSPIVVPSLASVMKKIGAPKKETIKKVQKTVVQKVNVKQEVVKQEIEKKEIEKKEKAEQSLVDTLLEKLQRKKPEPKIVEKVPEKTVYVLPAVKIRKPSPEKKEEIKPLDLKEVTQAWEMLKQIQDEIIEDPQKITIKEENKVTVRNTLEILGKRLAETTEDESVKRRLDSARMIKVLCTVFEKDLQKQEVDKLCLQPLLDQMSNDPAPQVREQITQWLPQMGILSGKIIYSLALRLQDPYPAVRDAALSALAGYNIHCNDHLKEAMIRFKILKPLQNQRYRSILDDLYQEYLINQEKKLQNSLNLVKEWKINN